MSQFEELVPTLGMYPFSSLKAQVEAEPDRAFIVDVGGSRGAVLMSIQEEAPAGFGAQMVLQDRPGVLDDVPQEAIPNITKMAHDFFTPQPVKSQYRREFITLVCVLIKNRCSLVLPSTSHAQLQRQRLQSNSQANCRCNGTYFSTPCRRIHLARPSQIGRRFHYSVDGLLHDYTFREGEDASGF